MTETDWHKIDSVCCSIWTASCNADPSSIKFVGSQSQVFSKLCLRLATSLFRACTTPAIVLSNPISHVLVPGQSTVGGGGKKSPKKPTNDGTGRDHYREDVELPLSKTQKSRPTAVVPKACS